MKGEPETGKGAGKASIAMIAMSTRLFLGKFEVCSVSLAELPAGFVHVVFTQTIFNRPYFRGSWWISTLPAGLEFSSADLLIAGNFKAPSGSPMIQHVDHVTIPNPFHEGWPASITASRTAGSRSSGTSSLSGSTQTSPPCSGTNL